MGPKMGPKMFYWATFLVQGYVAWQFRAKARQKFGDKVSVQFKEQRWKSRSYLFKEWGKNTDWNSEFSIWSKDTLQNLVSNWFVS